MDCVECSICNNAYNTQEYRPRVLPCGHSYCTTCLSKAFKEGFKSCPTCRKSIHLTTPHNLPINFDLEGATALVRISSTKVTKSDDIQLPSSELCDPHGEEIQHRCANHKVWLCNTCRKAHIQHGGTVCSVVSKKEALRRRKVNHHKYIDKDIEKYFQELYHIEQYAERLVEEEMKHDAMINRLESLVLHHRQVKSQLQAQQQKIDHILKDAKKKPGEFEALKNKLAASTSIQDITDICQEALKKGLILKEYGKQIRKKAICIEYIISSLKVRVSQNEFMSSGSIQDCQSTYHSPKNMNVKQDMLTLLKFWCTTNNRPTSGMKHIFAYTTLNQQGKELHAPLTVDGGRILLHVLRNMEGNTNQARNGFTLPYTSTRELVSVGSAVVFLDLAWPGSQSGRIFIKLIGNTGRCRQFLSLCTGEQGYSYANTSFHYSSNKGRPGEMITAGDYDNKGALPLLPGLTMGRKSQRPITAGLVSGVWDDDDPGENALFGIYVRDDINTKDPLGFAHVVEGMDVVRKAAAHNNIKEVRIIDCGVVLPSDAFEFPK
ncbi:unnamed protein product [Meganyctiphanes norvegica]|uniref:Uncharacterized protein n=1 Tax=Meganyctiphanes norvegica TaxID=48144 RepID=A0AAV2SLW9_MEGNR